MQDKDVKVQVEESIKSQERLHTVLDSLEAIVYVADMDTYEVLLINQHTRNLFGDIVGKICWQSLQVDQTGPCEFCTNKYLIDERGKPKGVYTWDFQNTKNGHWYNIRDRAIEWVDGRIVRLEIATDITKHKLTEKELIKKNEDLQTIFKAIPDLLFRLDEEGTIINYYAGEESDLYVPPAEFMNKNMLDVLPADISDKYEQGIQKSKKTHSSQTVEYSMLIGETDHFFEARILPLDKQVVIVVRNITPRKIMEEELKAAIITDELTGLFNRRGFFTLADQQCKMATRNKRTMALVYMDIDHLKIINDELGHGAGDQALKDAAKIFKKSFRKSDIIARIGGDEFTVLLTELSDPSTANIIINHLQENIKKHNEQGNLNYELSVTTGIAFYDPEHSCSIGDLLNQADKIMYSHKKT